MYGSARRYYLALGLLIATAVAANLLPLQRKTADASQAAAISAGYPFHVDLDGWYRTTPQESVVVSSFDLSWHHVSANLPERLGAYASRDLGSDPDIERWYDAPQVALRREYRDQDDNIVWLTVIASSGTKSFRIFEHTPLTCYPSSDWSTVEDASQRVPLDAGELVVRRALFLKDEYQHLVYYWYQWDDASRDPSDGVATWRVTTPIRMPASAEDVVEAAQRLDSFVALIFQRAVIWHRF